MGVDRPYTLDDLAELAAMASRGEHHDTLYLEFFLVHLHEEGVEAFLIRCGWKKVEGDA